MCVCVPHLYPIYNNRGFVINFANLSLCHINHFFYFFQFLPSLHQVNHLFPISPLVLFLLNFLLPHLTVTLTSLNHSPSFFSYFSPLIFFLSHITVTLLPTFLFFTLLLPHYSTPYRYNFSNPSSPFSPSFL